jgi:hypothetical protein
LTPLACVRRRCHSSPGTVIPCMGSPTWTGERRSAACALRENRHMPAIMSPPPTNARMSFSYSEPSSSRKPDMTNSTRYTTSWTNRNPAMPAPKATKPLPGPSEMAKISANQPPPTTRPSRFRPFSTFMGTTAPQAHQHTLDEMHAGHASGGDRDGRGDTEHR